VDTIALAATEGGLDLGQVDPYVLAAIGAAVVIGAVWALARGGRRDAMVDLAHWCEGHGLSYVPVTDPAVVGRFEGAGEGGAVTVEVLRLARRALTDLPPVMTRIRCAVNAKDGPVLVQPADWVMAVDGAALAPRCDIGSGAFAAQWAVYAADAAAAERLMTESVQRRLMAADAEGLAVSLGAGEVVTAQPGVVADVAELERRFELVNSLSRVIDHKD